MDRKKFEKAWKSSENVKEASERLGITDQSAYYWARKFGLSMFCADPDENSPTPEEIEERAAEVRSRWSPEEEQRRIVGNARRRRYEIPAYTKVFA